MRSNKVNKTCASMWVWRRLLAQALVWALTCVCVCALPVALAAGEQSVKLGDVGAGASVKIEQRINQTDPAVAKALAEINRKLSQPTAKDKENAQLRDANKALEEEIRRLRAQVALDVAQKAKAPDATAADKKVRDAYVKGDIAPTADALEAEEAQFTKQGKEKLPQAAERAKQLGVLVQVSDIERAIRALTRAVNLQPDDSLSRNLLGWATQHPWYEANDLMAYKIPYFDLVTGVSILQTGTSNLLVPGFQIFINFEDTDTNDISIVGCDSHATLDALRCRLEKIENLSRRYPDYPGTILWQHEMAVNHGKVGEILKMMGDLPAALAAFKQGLTIAKKLSLRDPDNTEWQRDLSMSHERVGSIFQAQGDLSAALVEFKHGLDIREKLSQRDLVNTEWQHELSQNYKRIGEILMTQYSFPAALAAFQHYSAIAEKLSQRDPGNTEWQRDLSVSHKKVGKILQAQGHLDAALDSFQHSFAIDEKLSQRDPGSALWKLDMVASCFQLASLSKANKQTDQARTWADKALAILTRLHQQSRLPPAKVEWIAIMKNFRAELDAK